MRMQTCQTVDLAKKAALSNPGSLTRRTLKPVKDAGVSKHTSADWLDSQGFTPPIPLLFLRLSYPSVHQPPSSPCPCYTPHTTTPASSQSHPRPPYTYPQ